MGIERTIHRRFQRIASAERELTTNACAAIAAKQNDPPTCRVDTFEDDHEYTSAPGNWFEICVRVTGTDHERVRKVFSERLAIAKTDPRVVQAIIDAGEPR